ncbi:MAG TPA: hypothetical protein VFA20_31915 [Myxococcaceae bacterium]|nr:hypothetical protein [Myxococcaceae bacterium]
MGRLLKTAALLLSLALAAGSVSAFAGPKKGGASKKGPSKGSGASAPARKESLDPLGDIGSGGAKGAQGAPAASSGGGGTPPQRGPTRIDFDDRLIQGQTNKSGAVYLYDRKELQTKSMVKRRESFRQEILSTVYDTQ